jgi:hypothetical protein
MFALGFLLAIGVFLAVLALVSKAVPRGKPRILFVVCVFGAIGIYPFFYKVTPSYRAFLELCESAERTVILRRQPVDYVLFEGGYSSDCTKGPAFVSGRAYLGFDCLRSDKAGRGLVRYTKNASWTDKCGLECFDVTPLGMPEAPYERKHRQGIIEGRTPVVTYDGTRANGFIRNEPPDTKLIFTDRVLWSNGTEMGHARDFIYMQYGNGWAKILGMASGSAPSMRCRVGFAPLDVRDAFPPRGSR